MSERALPIKVVYTVNPSPQPIVAYQKRTPVIVIPPVDGAQGSSSLGFGQAPLKACLRAICAASPHLLSDIERDYSVYVLDPLEEALTRLPLPSSIAGPQQAVQQLQASPAPGVAVGMGLMSWCLAEDQDNASEPTLVIGRLLKHPASGDMVEVVVTLQETRARSQERIVDRMKSRSTLSAAPSSSVASALGTGPKRGKRVGALPTPMSTSSPAQNGPREIVDLTTDEPQITTTSTKKRPDGKKSNLATAASQGPTPSPYQPHVYGSKALVAGSCRKSTLSGASVVKSAPLKRSMTSPANTSPLNSTSPIALLPAPADPFCPAIDIDIAGVSAYHVGQFLTTAARLAEGNPGTTVDVDVARNFRTAFPQLFPAETRRSPMPTSDAPKPAAPTTGASSVDRRPVGTNGTVSRLAKTDTSAPAALVPPKRPPALLPPPNLSTSRSTSRDPPALSESATALEPGSIDAVLDTDTPGEKENLSPDVTVIGKKRRLSDTAEETSQPRKKLNSEDNIPPTSTDPAGGLDPSSMPAPPSTPRAQRRTVSRPPSPTSSPLFSPDPNDLGSRIPRTPARIPTTPARPSGGTHRIFGSAHLSFSGMIEAPPFFSPLRRTPGTTALLFEMGIGHLSSSPIMRATSPTPADRARALPPSPWRSLQIDVGILPPSSPLPPTSSPAREFANLVDDDDADVKTESPVDCMPSGSRGHSELSEDSEGTNSRATSMSHESVVPPGYSFVDDQTLLADLDAGNYTHFDSLWALFQPMIAVGGAEQPQPGDSQPALLSEES